MGIVGELGEDVGLSDGEGFVRIPVGQWQCADCFVGVGDDPCGRIFPCDGEDGGVDETRLVLLNVQVVQYEAHMYRFGTDSQRMWAVAALDAGTGMWVAGQGLLVGARSWVCACFFV